MATMEKRHAAYMVLHADLRVRSMEAALEFYRKFGFSLVDDVLIQGPLARNVSLERYDAVRLVLLRVSSVGAMIELLEFKDPLGNNELDPPIGPGMVSLLVSDLKMHIDRASSEGLSPMSEIFPVRLSNQGNCKIVFYEDPDGNRLEFVEVGG